MVGTRNVLSFFQVSFHGWGLNSYFSKQICLLTEAKFSCCSVLIGQQRACRLGLAVVGMIWNSVSLRGKKRPLQSWVLQKGCLTLTRGTGGEGAANSPTHPSCSGQLPLLSGSVPLLHHALASVIQGFQELQESHYLGPD